MNKANSHRAEKPHVFPTNWLNDGLHFFSMFFPASPGRFPAMRVLNPTLLTPRNHSLRGLNILKQPLLGSKANGLFSIEKENSIAHVWDSQILIFTPL